MKNKALLYFAVVLSIISGCTKKADEIFDRSVDQRLSDALAAIQQALTSAPNGWKVYVYPKGLEKSENLQVGGFSYYMKFTDANRVTMYSDFDTSKAEVSAESGYRLKAAQRPSIYFDTYSYIHFPADPNSAISLSPAGSDGVGWGTDFEFAFTDEKITGDTVHLRGNLNNSLALMVKATPAEATAYNAKQLKTSIKNLKNLTALGYFRKMTLGSKSYFLAINETNRTVTFNWLDASGNQLSYTTGYFSTLSGIYFTNPFVDGSLIVPGIDFVSFNPTTNIFTVSAGNTTGTIVNPGAPLKLDKDAPKRWWQYSADRASLWSSYSGFTVNGVVDALKMRSITNFYGIFFFAKVNPIYDAFAVATIENNSLVPYGPLTTSPPNFTSDGRVIFTYSGRVYPGTPPGGTSQQLTALQALITDPNGYYLIQTGALTYDMVSRNGSAWISWEW